MLLRFSTSFALYVKRSSAAANEVSSFCNAIVVVWLHPFGGYGAQACTKLNHFLCVCGSLMSTFSRQRFPAPAIQVMSIYSVLLDTFTSHSFQNFLSLHSSLEWLEMFHHSTQLSASRPFYSFHKHSLLLLLRRHPNPNQK